MFNSVHLVICDTSKNLTCHNMCAYTIIILVASMYVILCIEDGQGIFFFFTGIFTARPAGRVISVLATTDSVRGVPEFNDPPYVLRTRRILEIIRNKSSR